MLSPSLSVSRCDPAHPGLRDRQVCVCQQCKKPVWGSIQKNLLMHTRVGPWKGEERLRTELNHGEHVA